MKRPHAHDKDQDKPDGPKEHFEAIRYLIGELRKTSNDNARATLDKISQRLDAIDGEKA